MNRFPGAAPDFHRMVCKWAAQMDANLVLTACSLAIAFLKAACAPYIRLGLGVLRIRSKRADAELGTGTSKARTL